MSIKVAPNHQVIYFGVFWFIDNEETYGFDTFLLQLLETISRLFSGTLTLTGHKIISSITEW